jgi:hypothetical protein
MNCLYITLFFNIVAGIFQTFIKSWNQLLYPRVIEVCRLYKRSKMAFRSFVRREHCIDNIFTEFLHITHAGNSCTESHRGEEHKDRRIFHTELRSEEASRTICCS